MGQFQTEKHVLARKLTKSPQPQQYWCSNAHPGVANPEPVFESWSPIQGRRPRRDAIRHDTSRRNAAHRDAALALPCRDDTRCAVVRIAGARRAAAHRDAGRDASGERPRRPVTGRHTALDGAGAGVVEVRRG